MHMCMLFLCMCVMYVCVCCVCSCVCVYMCMYECMYQKVGYVCSQAFTPEETFYINLIYNWGVSVTEMQFTIESPNVAQP